MCNKASLVTLCKKDLLDIYNHAIEAVKPDRLIKNAFSIKDNLLTIKDHKNHVSLDLKENNLHVIGGGKSVLAMACGLAEVANQANVTHLFSHGSISLPIGLRSSFQVDANAQSLLSSIGVRCLFGSENNLPDNKSVLASMSILDHVEIACDKDQIDRRRPLFIVLISGGGSACLTSPKFVDLDQKLELIRFLVQNGADIVELNKVRRYFSNIKGGQLALHIFKSHPESRILCLILSDVIGDPLEYIASGPTIVNVVNQHKQSMLDVLNKYDYTKLNLFQYQYNDDEDFAIDTKNRTTYNLVIGNNMLALRAAIDRAKYLGYIVDCIGNDLQDFSQVVVEKISRYGDEIFESKDNKILVIGGGEVRMQKLEGETWGKGGRAQEMALDYMISRMSEERFLNKSKIDMFLAGGTDGQDGPTDVAACLASFAEWTDDRGKKFNLDNAREAKKMHDSYNFWSKYKPEWLIKSGLTGTNVMDLYMYLVRNK